AGRPSARLDATKLERALLLYAARAAAKTSPFSVFMHQAVVEIADSADPLPQPDPADRDSRACVNRSLLFRLHQGAAAGAGDGGGGSPPNPSIPWQASGRLEALVPEHVMFSTRLLRLGRPRAFRFHRILAERLAGLPSRFSRTELRQVLTA